MNKHEVERYGPANTFPGIHESATESKKQKLAQLKSKLVSAIRIGSAVTLLSVLGLAAKEKGVEDGSAVEILTKDGARVLCVVGEDVGLVIPPPGSAGPSLPGLCNVEVPLDDIVEVTVNQQVYECRDGKLIPSDPSNCSPKSGKRQ